MAEFFAPADMTGRLFDRQAENTSSRQPDYTGQACIDGTVYHVSMWRNPPSENCKVATCSLKFETEAQHQERINSHSERRSRKPRAMGFSTKKYPRY